MVNKKEMGDKDIQKYLEETTENVLLTTFRVGSNKINYRILNMLPAKTKDILGKINLSKMPGNRRINDLEQANLIKRIRHEGRLEITDAGKAYLDVMVQFKKEIITEMSNLI